MAESLSEALAAADAAGEDTGITPTPAPAAEAAPAPQTESAEPAPADTAPPATGEREWSFDAAEFDEQHPELAPYRKQLQSSYTRKQQELAERQRAFEGLDEGSAAWVRQVNQLAQTQPTIAAQMLEAEAQRIKGIVQPQAPELPFEPLSDGERYLAEQNRQMREQLAQLELHRQRSEVEQIFARLERDAGRSIPFEERQRVAQFCQQRGIGDPEIAWKALNYEQAVQRGRDEAAGLMRQKAGMGAAPSPVSSREAPPGNREPKSQREAIQMAYDEAARAA